MLINLLAEQTVKLRPGAIILIAAPFIGEGGWTSEDIPQQSDFARLPRDVPVVLYHGSEDEIVPCAHVRLYGDAIPMAQPRLLNGRDHQLNNDVSELSADIRELR